MSATRIPDVDVPDARLTSVYNRVSEWFLGMVMDDENCIHNCRVNRRVPNVVWLNCVM